MKHLFMTLCLIFSLTSSKAQFYVGGSIGVGIVKQNGAESETTFKIIPELGYSISNDWAVGLAFGYKKGSCLVGKSYYDQNIRSKAIGLSPYARFSPIHISIVDLFIDGCFTYERIIDDGFNMNVGLKPGISIKPIKNLSIVAHLGFVGAELYKSDEGYKKGMAGVEIDASNFALGVNFNL